MSEDVPEDRTGPARAVASDPPPAAYGVRGGATPAETPPPPAPAGPHYGPVPRYARPQPGPHGAGPAATSSAAGPVGALPPGGGPVGPPPAPWAPWAPQVGAPHPVGPPPPYGPGAPWSPPLRGDYATWGRRVAGAAIDAAPGWVATIVLYAGYLPTYLGFFRGDLTVRPRYGLIVTGVLLSLAALGWAVYNRWFLAGRTGQSVGKRVMKTWLVSRTTGRPIGPFDAFVRDLLHIVDGFGYVGYLWPLWDDEHQTLADKLAQTVVVRTPVAPLTDAERQRR